jgi:hypothetical protein
MPGVDPVGGVVVRPPHLAHAAAAQQLDQPVAAERGPFHISLPGNGSSAKTICRELAVRTQTGNCATPFRRVATMQRYAAVDNDGMRAAMIAAIGDGPMTAKQRLVR